jgi:hypothetical protein
MLTFQLLYEEVQDQVQDHDEESLGIIKRAINQGQQKFGAVLNRDWRTKKVTFSTVADQRYYQLPENCIRPKTIVITIGGVAYPLTEVADDDAWNDLTAHSDTSDFPECYHVEGGDQFGIWPTPSSSVANAGTLRYESRMRRMNADDYTTGSIALTTGATTVTGTDTAFTAQMAGRTLLVEDGSDQDGIGYKIASFTDSGTLTLENVYGGLTVAAAAYRIGEVPDIPDEYHESLIDYGCYRYYKRRRDRGMSADSYAAFKASLDECRDAYSSSSSSQYTRAIRVSHGYVHRRRDYTIPS